VVRVAQLVASGVSLVATVTSFGVTHSDDVSYRLGSPAANLHLLATYSALLYAGWSFLCVEVLALAPRPRLPMMRLLDGSLAILLLVAAGVFTQSDYIRHCDTYGFMLACKGLHRAITTAVIVVVCFALSIGLTFVPCSRDRELPPLGYVAEMTPSRVVRSPQTPMTFRPTPATKL
jgi:hypothetical protein